MVVRRHGMNWSLPKCLLFILTFGFIRYDDEQGQSTFLSGREIEVEVRERKGGDARADGGVSWMVGEENPATCGAHPPPITETG